MIWQEPVSDPARGVSLHRHILDELRARCRVPLELSVSREVARAVERYLDLLPTSASIPDDYLAVLIARALRGAGEEDAARAVLAPLVPAGIKVDALERIATWRGLTPAGWRLCAARVVRPSSWSSEGGRTVWVLDLNRLRLDEDHCFELSFWQVLGRVLRSLCAVWDADGGEGMLAVSGLFIMARHLSSGVRRSRRFGKEVEQFCRETLSSCGERRDWSKVPRVLVLDAATAGAR